MADKTNIEWADATWNPLRAVRPIGPNGVDGTRVGWHCEHVSEGCRNCYAEDFNVNNRFKTGTGLPYKPGHRGDVQHILDEKTLQAPLRRKKPTRYFLSSMTDVFGAWVADQQLDRLFAVMALCPQHTFMVLTKRPERMRAYLTEMFEEPSMVTARRLARVWPAGVKVPADGLEIPLPNVWLGTSVEDQRAADERIPHLLATPAAVRFLSCEPLLGPVDLRTIYLRRDGQRMTELSNRLGDYVQPLTGNFTDSPRIDWVIVGGESGPGARPMHPDWARSLRDQCAAAGVAFHFKQWGEFVPCITDDTGEGLACHPDGADSPAFQKDARHPIVTAHGREFWRIGKARAGRLLDGRTHDDFPGAVWIGEAGPQPRRVTGKIIPEEEVPY